MIPFCGVRCVDFLSDYYSLTRPPFQTVASELTAAGTPDHRVSLGQIKRVLERRGVHTDALQLQPSDVLAWQYPVIVHLKSAHFPEGHFCVWFPSSTSHDVHLWMAQPGAAGTVMPSNDFTTHRSGFVLLTSPVAFQNTSDAVRYRISWMSWIGLALMIVVLVIPLVRVRWRWSSVAPQLARWLAVGRRLS